MVGKPNFPAEVAERTDKAGASSPTPGLPALDQEREASMADEGGASGMVMENDEHRRETAALAMDLDGDGVDDIELDPRVLLLGAGAIALLGFLAFRLRR
jgi:hypothetical protein